jgi:hypothetical protein
MKRRRFIRFPDAFNMSREEYIEGVKDCCERGLLTCTRGEPGAEGSTYALAWLPLDNPESFPPEVQERHAANMVRLLQAKGSA